MRLESFKTVSEVTAIWFGLFAASAGGIFTMNEYLESQARERVKYSMELLDRYHSEQVQAAYSQLSSTWARYIEPLKESAATPVKYHDLVRKVIEVENLDSSIRVMLDFHEMAIVCAEQGVCDLATNEKFFRSEAKAFFNMHFPYIKIQRDKRNTSTYACRLEAYLFGDPQTCQPTSSGT